MCLSLHSLFWNTCYYFESDHTVKWWRFLVQYGENDRLELGGWISPATFLCILELDYTMSKVFNGLFPAVVSLPRMVLMQISWHVVNHIITTLSKWRKPELLPWTMQAAHRFLKGQHCSCWATAMQGFMGVHEWAWWLINYNYQRPDNSLEMITTSSLLYCSGGISLSGV